MTKLLQKAIDAARKLPPEQQDTLGAIILEEIEDETQWAETFARTQGQLARWAAEVDKDIKAGNVTPLDFDRRGK